MTTAPLPGSPSLPVSAVIPAFDRLHSLLDVLERVKACVPAPAEIIVHADGASSEIMETVARLHPDVKVLSCQSLIGPGGARDALIRASRHKLIATFDDDSYPESPGYFEKVVADFERYPEMAVLAANVLPEPTPRPDGMERVAQFIGCGCVFNRDWYLRTSGFVPRPVAYGMEEADLSLQLHALGGLIIRDASLRVVHHRESHDRFDGVFHEEVTINSIMLPFLRYPLPVLPLVFWHLVTRLVWEFRTGWAGAALRGLMRAPSTLSAYSMYRHTVPASSVISWNRLKRTPPAKIDGAL